MNIKELVCEYESIPDNICGGSLHIVLDDGNLDDNSIISCYNHAKENKDYLGMLICSKLMGVDEGDRLDSITTKGVDYDADIMSYYYF